jgi:pimeloyl-ACP methyl ester carboxylesterase
MLTNRSLCVFGLLLFTPLLQSCNNHKPSEHESQRAQTPSSSKPAAPQAVAREGKPTAIIFVHGIHGDDIGTWTSDKTHAYFPDLVRGDTSVTDADVYTVKYPTPFSGNHNDVPDIAKSLMANIEDLVNHHSRIVFVCHSLGGLIAKEMLLDNPDLAKKVPFVIFYATPNTGAFIATFASVFNGDPLLKSMSNTGDQEYLLSLETRWQEKHYYEHIHKYCAYESAQMTPQSLQGVVKIAGPANSISALFPAYPSIFIVNVFSATYGCEPDSLANRVPANHIDISKPSSRDDVAYTIFKSYYAANGVTKSTTPSPVVFDKVICAFYGEANQGGRAWNKVEDCPIPDFTLLDPNYRQSPASFVPQHYITSKMTVADIPPGLEVQTDGGYHWGVLSGSLDSANKIFHIQLYCEPSGGSEGGCNIKVKIVAHYLVQPSEVVTNTAKVP